MKYLKYYDKHNEQFKDEVSRRYVVFCRHNADGSIRVDEVHWDSDTEEKIKVFVQTLIDEGYAVAYPVQENESIYDDLGIGGYSSKGIRIQILDTCPYSFSQIADLAEVALNNKQLYTDDNGDPIDNIIIWNDKTEYQGYGTSYSELPAGFTDAEIIEMYNGKVMNFQPQAVLFANVDFDGVDDFELTFAKGGNWMAISQGIFRGSALVNDPRKTPKNIKINIEENYSSVFQRMFQHCHTTERIEINAGTLNMQASGMFEYDAALREIVFNCDFNWYGGNLVKSTHNMFHGCANLEVVPLKASLEPTEANRESQMLSVTAGNCYDQMFCQCRHLTTIMPVLNFAKVTMDNLLGDGGTFTGCRSLSNIRIKNLANCDWDFVTVEGAALPAIDAESINYLLNNVSDVTEDGYTVRLPKLHEAEVDPAAIANAEANGWTVIFGDPDYIRSFDGWTVNETALGDYDFDDRQLTVRSFKPNTPLITYTPEVENDQTMNEAVYQYLYGFKTYIEGIEDQTGDDKLISWYKTNNDAGGYFCRGILVGPSYADGKLCVTGYPWEMGVPGGGFKKPNNGAHYYGYTADGNVDLYTYDSAHTYPENSAAYAALAIYTGTTPNADGYIVLDSPITIKLY